MQKAILTQVDCRIGHHHKLPRHFHWPKRYQLLRRQPAKLRVRFSFLYKNDNLKIKITKVNNKQKSTLNNKKYLFRLLNNTKVLLFTASYLMAD